MKRTVSLIFDYPYPAEQVWKVTTDLALLEEVMSGLIGFRALPTGQIFEGQRIKVGVSLFNFFPYQPYEMEVVEFDPNRHYFRSHERGAGVRSWEHQLKLDETQSGCRLLETVEIDAGILTPAFKAWAAWVYRRRHLPRLNILARLARENI
ncbi:MAG: SRPBCC family protein [Pseudomonadota bacterium]